MVYANQWTSFGENSSLQLLKCHLELIQLQNEALQIPKQKDFSLSNENLDDIPVFWGSTAVLFHVASNVHL